MSPSVLRPIIVRWHVASTWLVAWAIVLCSARVATAANAVLVTIRSTDATDPAPYELRLRSELASEGIDAIVANPNSVGGDAKQFASRFGANAVVEVTVSTSDLTTFVWTADSSLGLEVTRNLRVSNQQRDAVAVFALRTVDLLQGVRLDLEQQRRAKIAANASAVAATANAPPSSAPPPPAALPQPKAEPVRQVAPSKPIARISALPSNPKVTPPPEIGHGKVRIDLGYVLLVSSDKFGWSTAPALSVAWESDFHLGLGLTVSGPFLNRIVSESGLYDVAIDQEFIQLELRWNTKLGTNWAIEPYATIGTSRYAADGTGAKAPLAGVLATAWSFNSGAGTSLLWKMGEHLHWFADACGVIRWENPHVKIGGLDRTGNSHWNFLLKAGPGWYF